MFSKKTIAVLLAGAVMAASATAGVYIRTSVMDTPAQPGQMFLAEAVDAETKEVVDTMTFRFESTDDGWILPVPVVYSQEQLDGKVEVPPTDPAITIAVLGGGVPFDDGVDSTIEDSSADTPDVRDGVALEEQEEVVGEDSSLLETETSEEGYLGNAWGKIQSGLSATATKLEMLYESLKARVSEGEVHQDSPVSDGVEGATGDEEQEELAAEPTEDEAEEHSQVEELDEVK